MPQQQPQFIASAAHPALHRPVGLPLVTNGPDNANLNAYHRVRGRCGSNRPV